MSRTIIRVATRTVCLTALCFGLGIGIAAAQSGGAGASGGAAGASGGTGGAAATTGTASGAGPGSTGARPGATTDHQGGPSAGPGAPGSTGRAEPDGIGPGPSGAEIPIPRSGPGGSALPRESAGARSGGIQGTTGAVDPTLGSGSRSPNARPPDCVARADGAGFGPSPRIMADEPGRGGQSNGADARATTGTGAAGAPTARPAPGC